MWEGFSFAPMLQMVGNKKHTTNEISENKSLIFRDRFVSSPYNQNLLVMNTNKVTNYRERVLVRNLDTFEKLRCTIITLAGNLIAWEGMMEGTQTATDLATYLTAWDSLEVMAQLNQLQIMTSEAENDLADLERGREKE